MVADCDTPVMATALVRTYIHVHVPKHSPLELGPDCFFMYETIPAVDEQKTQINKHKKDKDSQRMH